jgi:A/G-specific adenine glycosylase
LIISEVLLQRTRAETVARVLPLFMARFPSWRQLSRASTEELYRVIVPLGLWRRRAVAIEALAREMHHRRGRWPRDRAAIEAIPGVGQYIASAVLLLVHQQPEPLIDVNMARVLERYFGPRTRADIRYDPYLQELARMVVGAVDPKRINWAILDLGAKVCMARDPACDRCPLRRGCGYARSRNGS